MFNSIRGLFLPETVLSGLRFFLLLLNLANNIITMYNIIL